LAGVFQGCGGFGRVRPSAPTPVTFSMSTESPGWTQGYQDRHGRICRPAPICGDGNRGTHHRHSLQARDLRWQAHVPGRRMVLSALKRSRTCPAARVGRRSGLVVVARARGETVILVSDR
jgi:hypothetical protein